MKGEAITDVVPNQIGYAPHIGGWGFEVIPVAMTPRTPVVFIFATEALAQRHRAAIVALLPDATDMAVG